jgi:putative aldouronate transport system substrate-binding protein
MSGFVLTALALAVISVAGCGKNVNRGVVEVSAATSAPGELPLSTAEVRPELTVLVVKPGYIIDLNKSEAARWYEEYTGVHVKYIHVPYENTRSSTNLLIASGEYPDIILNAGLYGMDALKYGNQGILLPMGDFIEEYGYFFKSAIERIPEIPSAITMPDGNIYGLPNINQAFHTYYTMKVWINEAWLTKLNLEVPTTTEEFYEVLKAFKTRDPNGNGKADEIPMLGYYAPFPRTWPQVFLLNSFVYFDPDNFMDMRDGKVRFVANTEEFREGLRYVARLVNEGLIDRASFTQNAEQAKQIGMNPNAQVIGAFSDFVWWNFVGTYPQTADHRSDNYIALAPLKGPQGVRFTPVKSTGYNPDWAHITDNARDPVLAFRWLDAMYSDEATFNIQLGLKGISTDVADEGSLGINHKPAIWKTIKRENPPTEDPYYIPQFLGNRYADLRLGEQTDWSDPMTPFSQEPRLYRETEEKYYPYRPREDQYLPLVLHHTIQENDDVSRLNAQLKSYTNESIVAFITGNKSLDRDWDAYVAEFKRLELPLYLQLKQTAYDRQYGKKQL